MSAEAGPPYPEARASFRLTSGRLVWVTNFSYGETYAGLLEGWPSDKLNREILQRALTDATTHMVPSAPVYMIPPIKEAVPAYVLDSYETYREQSKAMFKAPVPTPSLPPIRCIANLESEPMSKGFCGSHLKVFWFQRPFFDKPISAALEDSLCGIPWEQHAHDFDY